MSRPVNVTTGVDVGVCLIRLLIIQPVTGFLRTRNNVNGALGFYLVVFSAPLVPVRLVI